MDAKKTESNTKTIQLLSSGLADKPELAQRLLEIVKLANEPTEAGKVRSADEVEALLIEELHPAIARSDRSQSAKLFAAVAAGRLRLRDGSVL
jgi:hypothetical protein